MEPCLLGKKYSYFRKRNKMTQMELADEIKVGVERVIKVEKDKGKYTASQMKDIRALFKIESLPLTEHECAVFDARLHLWSDCINAGNMEKARAIHKEMANIDNLLPCDVNRVMRCKIVEIQMLIAEGDHKTAEAKLEMIKSYLDEMSVENEYSYLCYAGYFKITHNYHIDALHFLTKAQSLKESHSTIISPKESWLYNRIAACYTYLDAPNKAILYLHKIPLLSIEDRTTTLRLYSMRMLALNYIKMNELDEAKKLLDKCLVEAESHLSNEHTGRVMFNYGYMHKKTKNWTSAVDYFDKAIEYSEEDSDDYYAPLYQKIYCLIHANSFSKARALLTEAKNTCGSNKAWKIYFKALEYYLIISSRMTTYNEEACNYIEYIAIPHFHKMHDHCFALELYDLLERHYTKSRQNKKSSQMTKAMLKTHKRIFANVEE